MAARGTPAGRADRPGRVRAGDGAPVRLRGRSPADPDGSLDPTFGDGGTATVRSTRAGPPRYGVRGGGPAGREDRPGCGHADGVSALLRPTGPDRCFAAARLTRTGRWTRRSARGRPPSGFPTDVTTRRIEPRWGCSRTADRPGRAAGVVGPPSGLAGPQGRHHTDFAAVRLTPAGASSTPRSATGGTGVRLPHRRLGGQHRRDIRGRGRRSDPDGSARARRDGSHVHAGGVAAWPSVGPADRRREARTPGFEGERPDRRLVENSCRTASWSPGEWSGCQPERTGRRPVGRSSAAIAVGGSARDPV